MSGEGDHSSHSGEDSAVEQRCAESEVILGAHPLLPWLHR